VTAVAVTAYARCLKGCRAGADPCRVSASSHGADPPVPQRAGAGLRLALARLWPVLLFGVLPVVMLVTLTVSASGHGLAFDFHDDLWGAGRAILDGRSPYPTQLLDETARLVRAGHPGPQEFAAPVYPAAPLVAAVPFALLPSSVASVIFVLLLVPAPALALWLVGVRDWRVIGAAYLSIGTLHGITLGSLSPLLLVAVALTWRWRDRPLRVAAVVAAAVCAKLFLWPLAVWLAATRRWTAALWSGAMAGIVTLACWALMGFHGLLEYPKLLGDLSTIEQGRGYSAVAGGMALGLGAGTARLAAIAVGGAVLLAAVVLARRGREREALAVALLAALLLSPIVWLHYLPLLLVPLALVRPRLSWPWLLPLATLLTPNETTVDHRWWLVVVATSTVAVVLASMQPGRSRVGT
jgi:hypothetical protein